MTKLKKEDFYKTRDFLNSLIDELERQENTIKVSNSTDKDEKQDVKPVSPIQENDAFNEEPEEKKVDKVTANNKWVVEYINQLPVERDFSNSWYRAKDVISYAGLSWQGRISLKNIPIKWTVNKQKKLYISKEAIVYILFSGKSKKAISFTKKVIEELCND